MNEQLTNFATVRLHPGTAEEAIGLPDLQRCVGVAVEFNRCFISRGDDLANTFRSFLLEELLQLTGSEFGYIAEVLKDGAGVPYLKVFGYALTDISWDADTRALYEQHLEGGLEFHNLDSIWGEGVVTAGTVISNSELDPRRCGTPPGHPPLRAFIGLPLMVNGELRGQIGLANRVGGYEDAWPALLKPVMEACGTAMVVARGRIDQAQHTENLRLSRDLLARQHQEVMEILRVRDTFISSVVHELRTPMAAMVVYARLLQAESEADSEMREYADALNRNADRLIGLMDDVVLAATSPGNSVMLRRSETDLVVLVQRSIVDCVAALPSTSPSRGVPPTLSTEGNGPWILNIDALRITQTLNNVLSNALKYAFGAPILVNLRSNEEHIEVEVRDHGPGMSDDDVRRCRIPFYRGSGAMQSTTGGVGLGLTIAEQMITAHGGEMRIESALGEGTTVTLVIPR